MPSTTTERDYLKRIVSSDVNVDELKDSELADVWKKTIEERCIAAINETGIKHDANVNSILTYPSKSNSLHLYDCSAFDDLIECMIGIIRKIHHEEYKRWKNDKYERKNNRWVSKLTAKRTRGDDVNDVSSMRVVVCFQIHIVQK